MEARNALKVDRNANQSHVCTQKATLTAALHTDTRVSMKQDMDPKQSRRFNICVHVPHTHLVRAPPHIRKHL